MQSKMRVTSTRLQVGPHSGVENHSADLSTVPRERMSGRIVFIYVMWAFVWYDPDWFLQALGGGVILVKLYALMFIPVCILLLNHFRREALPWPYLLMLGVFLVWAPFVLNRAFLVNGFGKVLQYSLLTAATVSVLETPQQVVPLLKLFLFQFIWFGVQGLPTAGVPWHQNLSNDDSFGPFMTIGLGYSYYLARGTSIKKYRYLAYLVCVIGVAGTIVSFARGAILGLCVVFLALAIRAPKKLAFLGYGLLFALLGWVVVMVKFPNGEFWAEMETIAGEGNTAGTGLQRWVLWTAAWELFLENPLLGVGPGNFGPNAVAYYEERGVTDMGSTFDTPAKMYSVALHNDYLQVMVEQGLVGLFAMGALFFKFYRNLKFLRTQVVRRAWTIEVGGFIDSNSLALGLEAAMLGCMFSSAFYPQVFINYWMWSIMMLALLAAVISQKLMTRQAHAQASPSSRGLD